MKKRMKNKGKSNAFSQQFRGAMKYLWESKIYLYTITLIFISGIFLGFAFYSQFSFLDELLRELVGKIEGLSTSGIILFILQNNLKGAFYGLVFGVLLGIVPIINSIFNGFVLGYVLRGVWIDSGVREFWRILPHGIFELPAIFISLALGLKLGMFVFSKNKSKEFMERARNSMIIFVCIVIPLLIIAAIIEGLLISLYK
ncbi:MAG TPA: stage II sporulation protein M [Candidatus Nanoarchaeia archaeon]|nr:stage II sporulation protein M [Candidatus Nanoarchaeia archaeon]